MPSNQIPPKIPDYYRLPRIKQLYNRQYKNMYFRVYFGKNRKNAKLNHKDHKENLNDRSLFALL